MKIGMVCPYSWDVPGGVQVHIRDLAEEFMARGHEVSVLAPGDDDAAMEPYVVSAGRAVPVPYNGSVARLTFGPVSASRVRRWLSDGKFDVVQALDAGYPGIAGRVLDETGQIRRFVNVYVDDDDVRFASGLETPARDGKKVYIMPAVAGG